jgi:hypothetical protein
MAMPWEEEQEPIPAHGVSANEESDSDAEYIEKMLRPKKKEAVKSQPPVTIPLDEIEESLKIKETTAEPGTREYIAERIQDRGMCVFCGFESWNREILRRHILAHSEVKVFQRTYLDAVEYNERLLERKKQTIEGIDRLKHELQGLDHRIKKFNVSALKRNARIYDRLLRL